MQLFTSSPSTITRARAAVARVAADVRPRQVEVVAEEVDEQPARLDLALVALAVDLDRRSAGSSSAALTLALLSRPRAHRPRGADLGEVPPVVGRRVDVGGRVERVAGPRPPRAPPRSDGPRRSLASSALARTGVAATQPSATRAPPSAPTRRPR